MVFEHDFKKFPELSNKQLEEYGFLSPHEQITEDFFATVTKVHDGDTVTLSTDFRDFEFPLRFLNIDAPELSEGGEEAKAWLENKLKGKDVMILIDSQNRVGKYGRLLGRVLYQGLDVAEEMLQLGYVKEFGKKKEAEVPALDFVLREGATDATV